MPAFGLVYATANAAADVEIVTFGNLTDYDTTTYSLSANDTVFISAATAGALTNTAPTGETNLFRISVELLGLTLQQVSSRQAARVDPMRHLT